MFPSSGYFRGVTCPFYASGLCERPYCHYRHVKPTITAKQPSVTDSANSLSSLIGQANNTSVLIGRVKEEIIQVSESSMSLPAENALERLSDPTAATAAVELKPSNATYQPTPKVLLSSSLNAPVSATLKNPTTSRSLPQYVPTPIHILNRARAAATERQCGHDEYNPVDNYSVLRTTSSSALTAAARLTLADAEMPATSRSKVTELSAADVKVIEKTATSGFTSGRTSIPDELKAIEKGTVVAAESNFALSGKAHMTASSTCGNMLTDDINFQTLPSIKQEPVDYIETSTCTVAKSMQSSSTSNNAENKTTGVFNNIGVKNTPSNMPSNCTVANAIMHTTSITTNRSSVFDNRPATSINRGCDSVQTFDAENSRTGKESQKITSSTDRCLESLSAQALYSAGCASDITKRAIKANGEITASAAGISPSLVIECNSSEAQQGQTKVAEDQSLHSNLGRVDMAGCSIEASENLTIFSTKKYISKKFDLDVMQKIAEASSGKISHNLLGDKSRKLRDTKPRDSSCASKESSSRSHSASRDKVSSEYAKTLHSSSQRPSSTLHEKSHDSSQEKEKSQKLSSKLHNESRHSSHRPAHHSHSSSQSAPKTQPHDLIKHSHRSSHSSHKTSHASQNSSHLSSADETSSDIKEVNKLRANGSKVRTASLEAMVDVAADGMAKDCIQVGAAYNTLVTEKDKTENGGKLVAVDVASTKPITKQSSREHTSKHSAGHSTSSRQSSQHSSHSHHSKSSGHHISSREADLQSKTSHKHHDKTESRKDVKTVSREQSTSGTSPSSACDKIPSVAIVRVAKRTGDNICSPANARNRVPEVVISGTNSVGGVKNLSALDIHKTIKHVQANLFGEDSDDDVAEDQNSLPVQPPEKVSRLSCDASLVQTDNKERSHAKSGHSNKSIGHNHKSSSSQQKSSSRDDKSSAIMTEKLLKSMKDKLNTKSTVMHSAKQKAIENSSSFGSCSNDDDNYDGRRDNGESGWSDDDVMGGVSDFETCRRLYEEDEKSRRREGTGKEEGQEGANIGAMSNIESTKSSGPATAADDDESFVVSSKKRTAHSSLSNTVSVKRATLIRPAPRNHINPAQAMLRRMQECQERMKARQQSSSTTEQTDSSSLSGGKVVPAAVIAERTTLASGPLMEVGCRERVAHTPKQVVLIRPIIESDGTGKIPTNVRQRCLNLFVDESLKIYDQQQDAFDRSVNEEREIYTRSSNRAIYQNLMVGAVRRLRDEVEAVTGGRGSSAVGEEGCKSPLSRMVLSHEAVLGGAKAANTSYTLKRSRSNASNALQQNFNGASLYSSLEKYLLTEEQLIENSYPRPAEGSSVEEGRSGEVGGGGFVSIKLSDRDLASPTSSNPNNKLCCRCGKKFVLFPNGTFSSDEKCMYHWGKAWKKRVAGAITNVYTCCGSDLSIKGCQLSQYHVHDSNRYHDLSGYMTTLPSSPSNNPGVYSLDCEMVYTTFGVELARVTVIQSDCKVALDKLVKPDHPILDLNTRFSGITVDMMKDVTTNLRSIQAILLSMFNDKTILIGHSLESDLIALKLVHSYVVDTSVVFPHRLGPPYKRALRNIVSDTLMKIIQNDVGGHDSCEDATSCMELMIWKLKDDAKKVNKPSH